MPEMDIFSASGLLQNEHILASIQAYMLWPENEERRKTYVAEIYPLAITKLEKLSDQQLGAKILAQAHGMSAEQLAVEDLDAEAVHTLEEMAADEDTSFWKELIDQVREDTCRAIMTDFYKLGGGFRALLPTLKGSGPDMQKPRTAELRTAGAILRIVRTITERHAELKGPGSVNKAVFIMEKTGANYELPTSRTSILNCWRKYKKVSHLACAVNYCVWFPLFEDSDTLTPIALFLALARDYQLFATTHMSGWQAKGPLLDPDLIWRVPDDLRLPAPPREGPLPEDLLNALREYQAPI
jgi:hypothetical protein